MKHFINGFETLKSKSIILLNKLNHVTSGRNMKHTFEAKFEKVECYDIITNTKTSQHSSYAEKRSYKIETKDPIMISLSEKETKFFKNLIDKSLDDYLKGKIRITEESLIKYKNLEFALENKTQISKSCLDYVLADIQNNNNIKDSNSRL
jgi:hypothetical protein